MKIFLIALGVVVLIWLILSIIIGHKMIDIVMKARRKTYDEIKQQDKAYTEGFDDYENRWERHEFELPVEGAVISGEYIPNDMLTTKVKKVAIICHGHTVQRAADFKYARMFYQLGYNIIVFDQRYFGKSVCKYCTLGMNESKDIAALVRYARTIFGEDAFIALHGESMGAASELLSLKYESPDLVVADCPFATTTWQFKDVAKNMVGIFSPFAMFFGRYFGIFRAGYDFKKVNPIEGVEASNVPICFIHGLADSYITCRQSEAMMKVAKNPLCELHLVENAEHALSVGADYQGYIKIINEFVKKVEDASGKL